MAGGSSPKKSSSQGAWLGNKIFQGHIDVLRHHRLLPPASQWLHFFGLQPHHLAPNAILQLSPFVVLCEGFLGIEPRLDLWRSLFFFKHQSIAMEKAEVDKLAGPRPMTPCGAALVHHHSKTGFPQLPLQESIKQWQRGFFYVRSAEPAEDALNMSLFNIKPPTKLNWGGKVPQDDARGSADRRLPRHLGERRPPWP
ncbi:hypothetical protein D1007_12308 [Hordeum vulgare]|nr:hypothetical protein D1007_12308 [Hordeum vulgare]